MNQLLFKRNEAAKALGLSVHSLDALVRSRQIDTVKIGRAVRFHIDALESFAASGSPNLTTNGKPRKIA